MSQLMFWNKQNNNNNNNNNNSNNKEATNDAKNAKKNWLHTPDALVNGHVVYLVKFFGNLMVDQPKGIEVVKDAIRKLQFAQQMKKAETGTQEKFKKVEITISVDGVAVQEPRTQKILHQFPLHNISYCADEKGVKKFFSFIAKNVKPLDGNGNMNGLSSNVSSNSSTGGSSNTPESHECFVFISNKLASDITLTIGQAFELAYRKYMNTTEKTELGKAQQQIADLEKTVTIYKNRLRELSTKISKADLDTLLFKMGIKDILEVSNESSNPLANGNGIKMTNDDKLLIDTNSSHSNKSSNSTSYVPMVPPRNSIQSQILHKSSSQKMEELLLNSDSDSDFDPRADESIDSGSSKNDSSDLFGFEPAKTYGQQLFNNNSESKLNNNGTINNINSFTNEINIPPPLLAPPPKMAASRRSTSTTSNNNNNINTTNNNNNHILNGNADLFGSDPFDVNGPSIFTNKLSSISVDDFSLESLDPLRK
ncbi:PTB domain-containing adapter protein ced-6 [Teleopsis dalmanni]|uniref:PTB domain-containing adapter protein ced-6 n=1 Tax=Teleopsis dalmanni TaxID=139649 RepID=UPI0018CDCD5E|nr:PTB domain-containing adapter protein ced-6 [Teleopsis dalmanni]XP_037947841.1 PTB domain-containing adapter protein ced-6 [Teleopsis dalmanni]